MNKTIVCIVKSRVQAEKVVFELQNSGFDRSDISAVFPQGQGDQKVTFEENTKAPEGAVVGASAGSVLGGTLGLLAGIGALAIPGIGPFIAAGPLMAALSGMAAGATVGGITGALTGAGMTEIEAKQYEGELRNGNILISVHPKDAEKQKVAEKIFENSKKLESTQVHTKENRNESRI